MMAWALNLDQLARSMVHERLATLAGGVQVAQELISLAHEADQETLVAIARVLLVSEPPSWLGLAVDQNGICREYIPAQDLEHILWLGPKLDELLTEAYSCTVAKNDDLFRKQVGDCAEKIIFDAMDRAGKMPVHVSRISDSYGYDIECRAGGIDRIEVKAASARTQRTFHLSRNEYNQSLRFGPSWRLIQVVFESGAFIAPRIEASHIREIIELRAGALKALVQPDTSTFRWMESSEIQAPDSCWFPSDIVLDSTFSLTGFR